MQAWENFIASLETEMAGETIEKWLKSLKVLNFDACNLYLEAKDAFQALWFEEHIRKKVLQRLFNNNQKRIKVHLNVENTPSKIKNKQAAEKKSIINPSPSFNLVFDELEPHCTFSSFVVSESNLFSYKFISQIAGQSVTPTYVYGPEGSGKTHLLMAAAASFRSQGLHVIYAKAQSFTDHVVSAIRAGEMSAFRLAYRNSDVLIIDDVHVFSRKAATQEEFFHTFNTLHVAGKPIILSANSAAGGLQFIEPRLISRFEWGISLSLEIPPRECQEKIVQNLMQAMNFPLHSKVINFLLDTFQTPKSLKKSFNALILRTHLNAKTHKISSLNLTVLHIKELLNDLLLEQHEAALTPARILHHVAEHFGIRAEDILGKAQTRDCVLPRQISMHFCRQELKMPFLKIGELFSKDHSTVMSSVKLIQKGLDASEEEILIPYRTIQKKIKAPQ